MEELPHVRQLIHMAQGQLTTVTAMRDNKLFREEDFGFHAGRATELTLKAWIALTGNQYLLTHFLDQLFNQLEQAEVPETNQFRDLASLIELRSGLPIPDYRVARDGPRAGCRGCSQVGGICSGLWLTGPRQSRSVMNQPTYEELREAFQAGFDSIDEGDGFYPGFHAFLEYHGYRLHEDVPCTCMDRGAPTATSRNAAG